MKFDKIILTGTTSITLFDLRNPRSTPYTTRTIDGLSPTEVGVALAQNVDGGGLYIGRRPMLREITVNASLNPDYRNGQTPESLREDIYRLVPANEDSSLDFRLLLDGVDVAMTPVYVKLVEVSPFSKDTLFRIVMASTSEYLYRKIPLLDTNPSQGLNVTPTFVNVGSAPTGFKLKFKLHGSMTEWALRRAVPSEEIRIKHPFMLDDIVEINTNIGSRGVWLTRSGVRSSLIGKLTPQSTWIMLKSGQNPFVVEKGPLDNHSFAWESLEYNPKYLGV